MAVVVFQEVVGVAVAVRSVRATVTDLRVGAKMDHRVGFEPEWDSNQGSSTD